MRILPGSKTPRILELYDQGMRPPDIARVVQADRAYVYRLLRAHGRQTCRKAIGRMYVSPVEPGDFEWLRAEARKIGTSVADLARAMLTDAINEARHENDR